MQRAAAGHKAGRQPFAKAARKKNATDEESSPMHSDSTSAQMKRSSSA
jgi:hypothetical protein